MPRYIEFAAHVLLCVAMLWVAVGYAGHVMDNVRAGLWIGAVVDAVIWVIAVSLCIWSAREAARKSRG